MINLIKNFIPNKFSFYILGDFNLPNIEWNISSTTYNDCHISFIEFFQIIFLRNLLIHLHIKR